MWAFTPRCVSERRRSPAAPQALTPLRPAVYVFFRTFAHQIIRSSNMERVKVRDKEFTISISEEKIRERVRAVAAAISRDFEGRKPIFLAVLNGSFVFEGRQPRCLLWLRPQPAACRQARRWPRKRSHIPRMGRRGPSRHCKYATARYAAGRKARRGARYVLGICFRCLDAVVHSRSVPAVAAVSRRIC